MNPFFFQEIFWIFLKFKQICRNLFWLTLIFPERAFIRPPFLWQSCPETWDKMRAWERKKLQRKILISRRSPSQRLSFSRSDNHSDFDLVVPLQCYLDFDLPLMSFQVREIFWLELTQSLSIMWGWKYKTSWVITINVIYRLRCKI